jgi:hypothetical protein
LSVLSDTDKPRTRVPALEFTPLLATGKSPDRNVILEVFDRDGNQRVAALEAGHIYASEVRGPRLLSRHASLSERPAAGAGARAA